jgi:hypothetical protein
MPEENTLDWKIFKEVETMTTMIWISSLTSILFALENPMALDAAMEIHAPRPMFALLEFVMELLSHVLPMTVIQLLALAILLLDNAHGPLPNELTLMALLVLTQCHVTTPIVV